MKESVIPTVIEQLLVLPDDLQKQVLEFVQTLRATLQCGMPGKQLLQFAGMIPVDDLRCMQQAIEADCRQVNENEW